jgi:hypothetical protein
MRRLWQVEQGGGAGRWSREVEQRREADDRKSTRRKVESGQLIHVDEQLMHVDEESPLLSLFCRVMKP